MSLTCGCTHRVGLKLQASSSNFLGKFPLPASFSHLMRRSRIVPGKRRGSSTEVAKQSFLMFLPEVLIEGGSANDFSNEQK